MKLKEILNNYIPFNEQEQKDKVFMLKQLETNHDLFLRSNTAMHFSASCWIMNQTRDKVLMIYHKIYDSWAWCGGHADGEEGLLKVAQKELYEESGLNAHLVSDVPFSIEVLTVDGHIKKSEYVSSHLHLNVTYLFEASDEDLLVLNQQETSGIAWFNIEDVESKVSEKWMMENVYRKLIDKAQKM